MRLREFIVGDMEAIVAEWEAFAATLVPAATGMSSLALRDHAQAILEAIARTWARSSRAHSRKKNRRAVESRGAQCRREGVRSIDPVTRREMFDALKRGAVAPDGREASSGLGLGLFIVREIARAHGGDVDVRSEAGQTTFIVHLPRGAAATPEGHSG